jgi:hypothetical protein
MGRETDDAQAPLRGEDRERLLLLDLVPELQGGRQARHVQRTQFFQVCRRLLTAPTTDAERAGERLLVFATPDERDSEAIHLKVVGEESGDRYFLWRLFSEHGSPDFADFIAAYASTLRVCLNGPESSSAAEVSAMKELWLRAGYRRDRVS